MYDCILFVETGKELYKYTFKGLQLVGVEDLKDIMQLFQESLGRTLNLCFRRIVTLFFSFKFTSKIMYGDYF